MTGPDALRDAELRNDLAEGVVILAKQRDAAVARAEAAEQALAKVRELHVAEDKGWGRSVCGGCATEVTFTYWPCDTIRALDAATEGPRP